MGPPEFVCVKLDPQKEFNNSGMELRQAERAGQDNFAIQSADDFDHFLVVGD